MKPLFYVALALGISSAVSAQTQSTSVGYIKTALASVSSVAHQVKAINYRNASSSKVDMQGTSLMPSASGEAKVQSRNGRVEVELRVSGLEPATKFGMEFLTYVLWAISPQGRAVNLGELMLNHSEAKLKATTELQTFGLVITAEPYFAVTQPGSLVVSENVLRSDTAGREQQIQFSYELLGRDAYSSSNARINDAIFGIDSRTPLELFEARNAVRIAHNANADKYAASALANAEHSLASAESAYHAKAKASIATYARDAAQTAEDARVMSLKKQEEERLARDANERELQARAQAQAEAQRRQQAEEDRARAVAERGEAERMRKEAELAAQQAEQAKAQAEQAKAEAEAARQAALAQQQQLSVEADKARASAQEADRLRQQAEKEKTDLRARLLQQLSAVLETHDTARGLIANMGDVLFETGKYELKPEARERLAKVSGILLAYSSLKVAIEGHTDAVGTDDYNQRLSEHRAESVRDYLVNQGVAAPAITARGLGKAQPIASNDTQEGRQRNRRVELVLSGEAIGTDVAAAAPRGQ
ncbi:MAG: OmpA family protein [Terriglobales bacterium]|jgi:outer membrane protein OmpA-like peptidoglycan-associated protein